MNYYMPSTRDKGTFKHSKRQLETFTLLNTRREPILQEVYHSKVIKDTPTLYSSMMGPDTRSWCKYYSLKGHTTHDFLHLKREIERLIRQGQLRRYIDKKARGGKKALGRGETPQRTKVQKNTRIHLKDTP